MMGELPSTIGAYRIVRCLGEGGMGSVYEAVHQAIERRVAIKVLHPEYARNTEFTARFFNEARAVNRVEHPGLVQISDYGQQADGTAFIVMEFLKGESLARRIERSGGKLTAAEVIHLSSQIGDALAAAHAKDIVHRDLKPENVMLVPEPHMPGGERTKLLDFGIAKVTELGDKPRVQTKTDQFMGTPMYMSPEQCEGAGRVDAKSDVYSIGVMMFEMLAGQLPFIADGPGKLLGMHMFVEPPLLKEVAPHVPAPLAELVQRLLIKDRDKRPTMAELVAELTALAEQHPLPRPADSAHHAAMPPIDPLKATAHASTKSTLGASASQVSKPPSRRWGRLLGLSAVFVFLLGVGSVVLISKGLGPSTPGASILARVQQATGLGSGDPATPETTAPATNPPGSGPGVTGPPGSPTGTPGTPGVAPPPVGPSTESQLTKAGGTYPPLQLADAPATANAAGEDNPAPKPTTPSKATPAKPHYASKAKPGRPGLLKRLHGKIFRPKYKVRRRRR